MKHLVKISDYLLALTGALLMFFSGCRKDRSSAVLKSAFEKEVTDADGNIYKTVKINDQVWFAENLKTTKYNGGSKIPYITGRPDSDTISAPCYSWLYNNEQYKNTSGGLYNWYSVNTCKLCPVGWHVPTDSDWLKLTTWLGGDDIAGGKLKDTGRTWVECYPHPGAI